MWFEILCGLVIYRLVKRFFYDDDLTSLHASDSSALFSVAHRVEKLFGGKAYVALKIPDADTATPQTIDIVLLSKGEAVVIIVKNLSGFVRSNGDGSWTCENGHGTEHLPNPVEEAKKQASVLESYLEQRGVLLPEGFLSCKVILPNPKCCTFPSSPFPPEVITYEEWEKLKPEQKSVFSSFFKGAFRSVKKEMQESLQQKLTFILSSAPVWDKLELKGNKYVLGEFLEFKGKQEDLHALRNVKRSKISHLVIQKTSMLGLAHSKLQVLIAPRNYRSDGSSASEMKEVTVKSSTEVVFMPQNSGKVRQFKLSSIVSLSLSA